MNLKKIITHNDISLFIDLDSEATHKSIYGQENVAGNATGYAIERDLASGVEYIRRYTLTKTGLNRDVWFAHIYTAWKDVFFLTPETKIFYLRLKMAIEKAEIAGAGDGGKNEA